MQTTFFNIQSIYYIVNMNRTYVFYDTILCRNSIGLRNSEFRSGISKKNRRCETL